MAITYKQKCSRCNKNYVVANWKTRYVLCQECTGKEMKGEVRDPEMKKLFDIPEEFYTESPFLRSIKLNYLRYDSLSPEQIRAFKNVVKSFKDKKAGKPVAAPPKKAAEKPKPAPKKAAPKRKAKK